MLNWGIIGCGDVTEVKSGPAFNKVNGSKLVAVMRRNAEKARDYASRHRVPKWYADADELINDDEVNAIYIATPPLHHEAYTLRALAAGKPVYVEKPMAMNAGEAARMKEASERSGTLLSVAHYRREQPLFREVKRLLLEQAIGELRLVKLTLFQPHQSKLITQTDDNWRVNEAVAGGGLFHDLAPHQLDLMLHFLGDPVVVKGTSLNAGGYYGVPDTVAAHIQFNNHLLLSGTWSFVVNEAARADRCDIIGENGTISFAVFEHQQLTVTINGKTTVTEFGKLEHVQQPMIARVVDYFSGKGPNPCSAEDGVKVMEMIDRITAR